MEQFREQLISTFNRFNDGDDSSISEEHFLNINLNVFDSINNIVPIILDPNLNCEHTIQIDLSENFTDLIGKQSLFEKIVETELTTHILEEIEKKPNCRIFLCMFLYSVTIIQENSLKPRMIIKGNFKIKK